MTKHPELKRRVRARMAKTGESYTAARAHVVAERPGAAGDGTLHVTNGDATVPGLLATGLAETVLPWRDALHEGPVPAVRRGRGCGRSRRTRRSWPSARGRAA